MTSLFNVTIMSTTILVDAFNATNQELTSNGSHTEVALSLQWTRFAVQSVLTPVVVIVGLLGNLLNILVLLQPNMRTSTNIYILVLSLADSIFLVFNFALSFLDCRKRGLTDAAYYFNPYGRFVSNFSGNVAVWVTVSFTVERYIAVCHPMRGKIWCTVRRAKLASLGVTILALINTLPTIFELRVEETSKGLRCVPTQVAESMVYSWWYVTVFTFIPLVCLALFNIVLIKALLEASKNRQKLVMIQSGSTAKSGVGVASSKKHSSRNGVTASKGINEKSLKSTFNGMSEPSIDDRLPSSTSQSCVHYSPNEVSPERDDHSCKQVKQSSTRLLHKSNSSGNTAYNQESINISGRTKGSDTSNHMAKRQSKRMSREQHKVTLLLVTIVMIFLLCQLPWTALFLYTTYLDNNNLTGNRTHIKIAGNICNWLVLINSSVNFYLYSCFSKRFRQTLTTLILFWRRKSHTPVNF